MEKVKAFPLRSGTSQGCPLFALLFNNIVLKLLAMAFIKEKTNKRNPDGKCSLNCFFVLVNDNIKIQHPFIEKKQKQKPLNK